MSPHASPLYLYEGQYDAVNLEELKQNPLWRTIDIYELQLNELFEIDNPNLLHDPDFEKHKQIYVSQTQGEQPQLRGNWVYFPWSGTLMHMVDADTYDRLRTNRNQNLITADEQAKINKFRVGITGLSVGNSIAVGLAYSGIGTFHLAEFDSLETVNLNRLRSGVHQIGQSKLDITTQQIYEINPYARIESWPKGLRETDLKGFLGLEQSLNVVFDEIDDFEMKIRLRIAAKKARVPVVMFTSLGDNVLVDVERYDLEPDLPLFNGLLGNVPEEILRTTIGEKEKIKYAMQIVGVDYVPTRALASLLEINRTLVGRPQLYSTIAVESGLAGYVTKRLALSWPLPSGRWYVPFDTLLNLPAIDEDSRQDILQKLKDFTGA